MRTLENCALIAVIVADKRVGTRRFMYEKNNNKHSHTAAKKVRRSVFRGKKELTFIETIFLPSHRTNLTTEENNITQKG